ncbi:TolC family protein [Ramlibacter ginsenosidimutans]|uniref:TolC family protein n=1 Tax=Ramlibacter ginsenosidimutans TaxID=502333 RepID=A0A934TXW5_9BURK|nr:TolC family protein [Ramlibacter ginsenosidimutans]MBK6008662.1 TolC family protein [Ramlibacter ginsenosidimutans]
MPLLNPSQRAPAALAIAAALALAGCATPNAHPSVDVPAQFTSAPAAAEEAAVAWWDSFHDPALSDLVRRAARENRDIRMAAQRLRAARAGETISRSALFPSVDLSASGVHRDTRHPDAVKQLVPDAKTGNAGLGVSWELDLSGRLRAGASAARADALAAEDGVRGVRLLVVSDVATNYFTLVGAQRQLETMRAISAAQDETLRLVSARQRAGLATPFDVERAQTEAGTARAAIPPLESAAAIARHRIAVLIGDQASRAGAIVPWTGEAAVPPTHAGQPATLLQRRPDLLALNAQLDAANARRQQAAAEWFPRLFLGAMFGREGLELNGVDLGAARFTNVTGLLAMPIFNAGRTRALNDAAQSAQDEAALRYEDGIVRALEDVENALVVLHDEREREASMRQAASSADSALQRAESLYHRGQIDLLPLLDAQRTRLNVRLAANDSHTQLLLDSVRLYKALGGGWEAFEPAPPAAAASAPSSQS